MMQQGHDINQKSQQTCVTSYEHEKKRLKIVLKGINRVSITTDLWKSGQKVQYMVITCHFVDNWKLQKRVLNFVSVPPPHSGIVVHDALYKCFEEWGIEKKVATITVDNASYNDTAVKMLKDSLNFQKKLLCNGALFHVRCCAHILNLLVQDGISEIQHVIENIRQSVKYISASIARLSTFSDIAKQLHLPTKRMILDCCTRWNATYNMLACALEFRKVFPRYQERDQHYMYLPSEEDWDRVEDVCSFLAIFNEVTNIISANVDKIVDGDSQDINAASSSGVGNTASTCTLGNSILSGRRKFDQYIRSVDTNENVRSELDVYLQEVASEATFSAGGRVIDTYRSSLGVETVQALICGEDWFRNFYGIKRKAKVMEDVKEILLP